MLFNNCLIIDKFFEAKFEIIDDQGVGDLTIFLITQYISHAKTHTTTELIPMIRLKSNVSG